MIAAIAMVKDEADVIRRTLEHLAQEGVDSIYLAENGSTDGTWEIVRDMRDAETLRAAYGTHLEVISDPEVGYYQSRKMTTLALHAYEEGADWIIPFDADELWTIIPGGECAGECATLRAFLERQPEGVGVIPFQNYNHYRTALDPGGHPFDAMGWRGAEPLPLGKVAFRAGASAVVGAGNHDVAHARGRVQPYAGTRIHHYPYRSVEQFISKARNGSAAYAATDLPRSTGQHWREWGDTLREHGEAGLRKWYRDAFVFGKDPDAHGLVFDPVRSPR
jgi:hypothetical protein